MTRRFSFFGRLTALLAAGICILFLFSSVPAHAQGCALCYTQAASSGHRTIQALRNGILILVIPPMFLSVAFTVLVYRKRNQFRDSVYPARVNTSSAQQPDDSSRQVRFAKGDSFHSTLGPKWRHN